MPQSETIGKLAEALAKAQGTIRHAVRSAENPFFKSRYADLAAVWTACREPLSANGLAVVQTTVAGDAVTVVTTLIHSSGEWVSGELSVLPAKRDPQVAGSAITYLRRYGLAAIAGVATEDDDAESATDHGAKASPRPVTNPPGTSADPSGGYKGITNEQAQRVFALGSERAAALRIASKGAGEKIVREVYAALGITNTAGIPVERYDEVCAAVAAWEGK